MVIKGGARSGPGELALHLLRADTNETVTVRELRHVMATDLTAALHEMEAMGLSSRSERRLYHANIDWRCDEHMTDAQKASAVERLAAELGLSGQPRAVVEHVKHGREHLHVVWLRIDTETGKAISDSHNYRRHEIVARDLEREFGHERVQGVHVERDGVERPARTPSLAEMRQAERSGISPEDAKARLRELWDSADGGRSFAAALEDAGWILARGDKRGFVVLDPAGEVRSVNKDVTGLSAARVRERLADIEIDQLPSVDDARARQRDRHRERDQVAEQARVPAPESEQAQPLSEPRHVAEREEQAIQPPAPEPHQVEAMLPVEVLRVPLPSFGYSASMTLMLDLAGWRIAPPAEPAGTPEPPRQEPEPAQIPETGTPRRHQLAGLIQAARDKLAGLAERLERAFQPYRERQAVQDGHADRQHEHRVDSLPATPEQTLSAYDRLAALLGTKTPPVARFGQPRLLQALEKAHREATDRELKRVLRSSRDRSQDGYDGPEF
jgi:hypothetical protein